MNPSDLISVWVPTSPSPKHPSTELLEMAIDSVRWHLPAVEIIIQMDGVRAENENRREAYEEYKRRVKILCSTRYTNVMTFEFSEFYHQAEMCRATFPLTSKPLLLYHEWDWYFTKDPIDWVGLCEILLHGDVNSVRFMRWDQIIECHEYLMHGRVEFRGVPVVKTTQFSGNPQIASKAFFERLIGMFRVGCRTLIEEFLYGPVVNAPWEEYKCAVYNPPGSMRRLIHTDGRGQDPKFPAQF
jgi:hypothetical protein